MVIIKERTLIIIIIKKKKEQDGTRERTVGIHLCEVVVKKRKPWIILIYRRQGSGRDI
jgi:hypothetical protein